MKLWAKNNKLYYGHTRIGQVIIHRFKQEELPIYKEIDEQLNKENMLYHTNFADISKQLIIDYDKFQELLKKQDWKTLTTLPLYNTKYYPKWLLPNLKPVPFDFIQVEGKLLIYADKDQVKIIGELDEETSYYLLYYGIVISDNQVIQGINYAIKNNQNLRSIGEESFKILSQLTKLMKTGYINKIKKIKKEENNITIITDIGVFYGTTSILTNDNTILKQKHLFKSGTIIKVAENNYIALDYELKTTPTVYIEMNKHSTTEEVQTLLTPNLLHPENPIPYIPIKQQKIYLQGHLSPLNSTIQINNKQYKVNLPKSIKITSKPTLKKINNKWLITYNIEYTLARLTTTYIDTIDSLINSQNITDKPLKFNKLSKKLTTTQYKTLIDKIAQAPLFQNFNKITNNNTHLYYKVNDLNFKDGLIYIMGYGNLNIKGTTIKNEYGEDNLIIKTETGDYKIYKIIRIDNIFKPKLTGKNYIINNTQNKLTIKTAQNLAQLLTLVNTIPLNYTIKTTEDTIKIVINKRKLFTYKQEDFNITNIKNTFIIYSGTPPKSFTLPIEHEIIKNFISAIFINFNKKEGNWFLGNPTNKKPTFINYKYFNGTKTDKPLFTQGTFEITGVKIKPTNYQEQNNEYSVIITDLQGETIKIPIIKSRSLLTYTT